MPMISNHLSLLNMPLNHYPALEYIFQENKFQFWTLGYTDIESVILAYGHHNEGVLKKFLEQLICDNSDYSLQYVWYVYHMPWPPGEKAIATSPHYAFYYALKTIQKRWPLGEPIIASHPYYAYAYARDIIKEPWPLGEHAIASDPHWKNKYEKCFFVKI